MAACYQIHKNEELRENLVSIVGLWPAVASKLGITIKQAATFVEDKFFLLELVMYTDHEYTGLWRPTEGLEGERAITRTYLMDAWNSCESKGWTKESLIEWEFMRITPNEANEIWHEVERIRKATPMREAESKRMLSQGENSDIDPSDLPEELDAANVAFRAVLNGHGEQAATFKNRLIDYLKTNYPHLKMEAVDRIATVANPDKARGRKKRDIE